MREEAQLKVDVVKLDRQIKFLTDQAVTLRRTQQGASWAMNRAAQFEEVAETLKEIRQEHQMTGVGGRRIE
jgi:hypothetical protein